MLYLKEFIFWTNVFFGQKLPIKFQLFGLSTACVKLSKFLMWFWKPGVSFCINFAPFCWNISVKFKWNFLETPIQSVQRSFNLLFQHIFVLMFPLFKKHLNTQVRTNKFVNSVVYHPYNWRLASGIHPFIFL